MSKSVRSNDGGNPFSSVPENIGKKAESKPLSTESNTSSPTQLNSDAQSGL